MKNETIIELKVGYESEYAETGIETIKLTLHKVFLLKLQMAMKYCKTMGYFCIEMFCPTMPQYFDGDGNEIITSKSNFRIGAEYFKVYSSGDICLYAENKWDSTAYFESEEFTLDEKRNVVVYSDIIGSKSE